MEVSDNKISVPGFEKFSTVQDILEQNKCVTFDNDPAFLRMTGAQLNLLCADRLERVL